MASQENGCLQTILGRDEGWASKSRSLGPSEVKVNDLHKAYAFWRFYCKGHTATFWTFGLSNTQEHHFGWSILKKLPTKNPNYDWNPIVNMCFIQPGHFFSTSDSPWPGTDLALTYPWWHEVILAKMPWHAVMKPLSLLIRSTILKWKVIN